MITKFDTSGSAPASTGSANGTNTLVILVVVVVAAFVVYKFVIKPAMDKKKEEAAKTT